MFGLSFGASRSCIAFSALAHLYIGILMFNKLLFWPNTFHFGICTRELKRGNVESFLVDF